MAPFVVNPENVHEFRDMKTLEAWYRKHLGLPMQFGAWSFAWRDVKHPTKKGLTVLSAMESKSGYFKPSKKPFMFNFRVANLRRVLGELKKEGVKVDRRILESDEGRFGWIMDNEGNRIELWEPPRA